VDLQINIWREDSPFGFQASSVFMEPNMPTWMGGLVVRLCGLPGPLISYVSMASALCLSGDAARSAHLRLRHGWREHHTLDVYFSLFGGSA